VVKPSCPFCTLPPERIVTANESGWVVLDGYPVSNGHTLVIPRRHIGSFFELAAAERQQLLELLDLSRAELDAELSPQGYNFVINDGPAAGQTVPHLHIHLIPRYTGDMADPRGGVGWVIPDKAKYWT